MGELASIIIGGLLVILFALLTVLASRADEVRHEKCLRLDSCVSDEQELIMKKHLGE
jgi:hypothetical protein